MAHEGTYRSDLVEAPPRFSQRLTRRARWRVCRPCPNWPPNAGRGSKPDRVCGTVMYTGNRFMPGAVLLGDVCRDGRVLALALSSGTLIGTVFT
jgi:hypothetical protein